MQSSRIGAPQGGMRKSTRTVAAHSVAARRKSLGQRMAFTLLELLIAIAIIGVLAGLILQVASSASTKAHNAQVSADILTLSTGISAFKQRFGIEPPSSIYLYEQAGGWTNTTDSNALRSMSIIRQIWPQFDFTYAAEGGQIDINGDGFYDGDGTTNPTGGAIPLSNAECLVFFLGGMPTPSASANHYYQNPVPSPVQAGPPTGFSPSPVDPFNRTGSNRLSFTEFDKTRLLLYSPSAGSLRTMNTYVDTLSGQTQPYLYLSAYGGQGYNVAGELASLPGGTFADIYRLGPNGSTTTTPSPPWNPNTYQIISPGGDHQYGYGGEYESGDPKGLLVGPRAVERDNITNLTGGTLAP
jgi:prepilin-type N-terminal cleavage/methylation domain-containing protein